MSPEIFTQTPTPGYNGKLADIWACGVILYLMLTREKPFDGEDILELQKNIINKEYKKLSTFSDNLNDLFSKIFIKDPNKRMTMSELKHHPWIISFLNDPNDKTSTPRPAVVHPNNPILSTEIEPKPILTDV